MIVEFDSVLQKDSSNVAVFELQSEFAVIAILFNRRSRSHKDSTDLQIILSIKTKKEIDEKEMNYSMKERK